MNLSDVKRARELKSKLDQAQKELKNIIIEVSVGKGGTVKVAVDGQQQLRSITISPEVINPEKPKQLEDLIMKAVNEAMSKSQKEAAKQLQSLTGGLKIPGLF